jgi:hypothetical protein
MILKTGIQFQARARYFLFATSSKLVLGHCHLIPNGNRGLDSADDHLPTCSVEANNNTSSWA